MTITAISIPAANFTAVAIPPFAPWKGNWNQTTQYLVNDFVFRGVSTWRAVAVNLNDDPGAGSPTGNWVLVALGADQTVLNAAAATATSASTQAATSATAAAASATLAAAQISGAAAYATNAQTSATAAAASAVSAQTATGAVTTSATAAASSATAAASSATAAAGSATTAAGSATSAAASAVTAAGYAAGGVSPSGSFTAGHLVQSATTGTTSIQISDTGVAFAGLAPLASPALTGTPTAPTPTAGDNSTKIATTAFTAALFATASSFSVSGIAAVNSAHTILAIEKGTMFDITGSFALTLPAQSGASSIAPLYYHVRKRDGSGVCTIAPNGTDTIEGVNASISVYQERVTLVTFGSGWYFPPGGRERIVYVVPPTAFSAVSALAVLTGFDPGVAEVEVSIDGGVLSGTGVALNTQFFQNGAYVTSGYSYFGADSQGATFGDDFVKSTGTLIPVTTSTGYSSGAIIALTMTFRNVQSTTANAISVEARGSIISSGAASSTVFDIRGTSGSAFALGGAKVYPASGTISGVYSQRITRA